MSTWIPYVVRQGDYLAKLAYRYRFDADAVWNDDRNADLRQRRSGGHVLLPTDILYIPDPPPPRVLRVGNGCLPRGSSGGARGRAITHRSVCDKLRS